MSFISNGILDLAISHMEVFLVNSCLPRSGTYKMGHCHQLEQQVTLWDDILIRLSVSHGHICQENEGGLLVKVEKRIGRGPWRSPQSQGSWVRLLCALFSCLILWKKEKVGYLLGKHNHVRFGCKCPEGWSLPPRKESVVFLVFPSSAQTSSHDSIAEIPRPVCISKVSDSSKQ